jgi:hypothetical protein
MFGNTGQLISNQSSNGGLAGFLAPTTPDED